MEAISIFGINITDNLLDKSSIKGNAKMNKNEREELGKKNGNTKQVLISHSHSRIFSHLFSSFSPH